jgi:hypothetical protein
MDDVFSFLGTDAARESSRIKRDIRRVCEDPVGLATNST